jgi:hypothetical protein
MFGGVNKFNDPQNTLKLLKVSKKSPEWIDPVTKGMPPNPRHSCSFNLYDRLDIIILYGGRDNTNVFNDIYILELYNFEWIRVPVREFIPKSRYGHSAVIHNENLIIFGGTDNSKYIGSELYILDLCSFDNLKSFWTNDNQI